MVIGSGILELWINAFIPRHVGSYTQLVSKGLHAGKTAVPLPGIARFNPMNWDHDWESGFLTDQRSFSPSRSASVRMQSAVDITVAPFGMVSKPARPRTSGTVGVNLATGEVKGNSKARLQKCRITVPKIAGSKAPPPSKGDAQVLLLEVFGAASDPLVSLSADIDYRGHFQIIRKLDQSALTVNFIGVIDDFPAFESYARWNGETRTLFQSPPPVGNTVVDLLGPPSRWIQGGTTFG